MGIPCKSQVPFGYSASCIEATGEDQWLLARRAKAFAVGAMELRIRACLRDRRQGELPLTWDGGCGKDVADG